MKVTLIPASTTEGTRTYEAVHELQMVNASSEGPVVITGTTLFINASAYGAIRVER